MKVATKNELVPFPVRLLNLKSQYKLDSASQIPHSLLLLLLFYPLLTASMKLDGALMMMDDEIAENASTNALVILLAEVKVKAREAKGS